MLDLYWTLCNLFVPVLFAPFLIFLPFLTGSQWPIVWGRLKASIGDGQLLWAAIGIAATSAYDAGVAAFVTKQGNVVAFHIVFFVQMAIAAVSSFIVNNASQTLFSYEESLRHAYANNLALPTKNMGMTVHISIFTTLVAGWLAVYLKFFLTV